MQVTAKLRHLRIAPRKVRLVAEVIRGLDVEAAEKQLGFINKRAARPMLKLLNSAVANGVNNFKLKKDNLFISELRVDEGPTLKRWTPRAFGRASAIHKRTSHITIILDERVKSDKSDSAPRKKKESKKDDTRLPDGQEDVKVIKNFEELKELEKEMDKEADKPRAEDDWDESETEEYKPEIKDIRREGSDRGKQHLDKVRKKQKGGGIKRFFRRKSV